MAYAAWPPSTGQADITYLVNFFRGKPASIPCNFNGFFAAADINGDCSTTGSDVTYFVNHFRGINPILYCPDTPPEWLSDEDVPTTAPDGWPLCE